MARLRAVIALAAFALAASPAAAQSLQRLTVTQLTLASNQAGPQIEVPFDLVVTARVRERVSELRNLDLPILSELELLGDEHTLVAGADGTTYTERIRVVAHHSGTITIAPVTLDAIDARDGKAKRYSSNSLTLTVGGGVAAVTPSIDIAGAVGTLLRWSIGIVALALVLALLFRRRRRAAVVPAPPPEPAVVPVAMPVMTRESRLRDARTLLAAERSRSAVLRVRTVAREMVGATDAETLGDVLNRTNANDASMRALLVALERAAFTHDEDFQRAVDEAIARLEEASR